MSEMVERVAGVLKPYFSAADRALGEHVLAAQEVIAAMREPTEAQFIAGMRASPDRIQDPAEIWQAMIDEALRENSHA